MCVSLDAFIIRMLRLSVPLRTATMRLKAVVIIFLAVFVLNFILSHFANSIRFS
jgi:hypothetical protein